MYLPSEKELQNFNAVKILVNNFNQEKEIAISGKILNVKIEDETFIIQTTDELACFTLDKIIYYQFYYAPNYQSSYE